MQRQFDREIIVFSANGIGRIGPHINHLTGLLLCLASLNILFLRFIHVAYIFLFSIPLLNIPIIYLFIHLLVGIWIVSGFGLFWKDMLWKFLENSLCEHMLLFLWLRTHKYSYCQFYLKKKPVKHFSIVFVSIYTHQLYMSLVALLPMPILGIAAPFDFCHSVSVHWYLILG